MLASVFSCHGCRPAASAKPPQRLTTRSSSTQTATAAPTSSRSVKLDSKASRTRSNPCAHEPLMGTLHSSSKNPPGGGPLYARATGGDRTPCTLSPTVAGQRRCESERHTPVTHSEPNYQPLQR